MAYTIREANASDILHMARVAEEAWLATYPNDELGITRDDIRAIGFLDPERINERMRTFEQNDIDHSWVAESEGSVVGFCRVRKKEDYREVRAMYVRPAYQGRGIGRALIEQAIDWLGTDSDIYLHVATYNEKAKSFYGKNGFSETGVKVGSAIATLPSGKVIPEMEMRRPAG